MSPQLARVLRTLVGGAAVLRLCRAVQVRAVLTGALTLTDGTVLNTATELNSFVYNTIASWCESQCDTRSASHMFFLLSV